MAWHRSRVKRKKQAEKAHNRNVSVKKSIKKLTKELLALINDKKISEAKESLKKIAKVYAVTAQRGILRKETASRHISRLAKKINSIAVTA